jgi:hypothetical protein
VTNDEMDRHVDAVLKSLRPIEDAQKSFRVRVIGSDAFVKTDSGKSVWRTAAHAKLAIREHVSNHVRDWVIREEVYKAVMTRLEIVPLVPCWHQMGVKQGGRHAKG